MTTEYNEEKEMQTFNLDVRKAQISELLHYGVDADFIIQLASLEPDALTDFINGIRKLRDVGVIGDNQNE